MHAMSDKAASIERARCDVLKQHYDVWHPRIGKIVRWDTQTMDDTMTALITGVEIRTDTRSADNVATLLYVDYIEDSGECDYVYFDGYVPLEEDERHVRPI